MTTTSPRGDRSSARPVVRLFRATLAMAMGFLTVPFLTLVPAYADDAAATPTSVVSTEVVDPPPDTSTDQPPADTPAAQEPAPDPAAQEPPAPESPAPDTTAPDPGPDPSTTDTGDKGKGGSGTVTTLKVTPQVDPLPAPDCSVTDFDQNKREDATGDWINGALNQTNSNYAEGDFVPQKVELGGLVPGDYTIGFTFDRTKNGKFAYDYVAGLQILGSAGASATWTSAIADFDGPAPTNSPGGTYSVEVTIHFTITDASDATATLRWTGHIASEIDYGPGSGAGSISGAPYHFSLISTGGDFGCDAGKRDNQLMADAVDAGTITIIKDAQPNAAQDFHFGITAPNNLDTTFDLDDDADATLSNTVTYRVPPGTTTVSELNIPDGWTLTDITCSKAATETATSASVSIADDEAVTCTFTNSRTSSLEVDKYWVINGGTPVQEGSEPAVLGLGAQLTVDGTNKPWDTALSGYLNGASVSLNESVTFGNDLCDWAGTTHGHVTEVNGTATDAALPDSIALDGGANHATITNEVTCAGELVLKKVVDNSNGGTAVPGDFTLVASPAGGGADLTTPGSTAGHSLIVTAGTSYDLSETDGPSGYDLSGIDCGAGPVTSVQVPAGQTRTCTFTNHDNPGSLTLVKVVDHNDTGDTTPASAWTLTATPDGITGQSTISGTTGVSGATKAGTYDLSEDGPSTYSSGTWSCTDAGGSVAVSDGAVTVPPDDDVTCTITNTAIAPQLTLVKIVDPLDTGDLTQPSAFTLTATPDGIDGQDPLSGPGPQVDGTVMVGTYDLSESGPVGYDPSEAGWSCVDQDQHSVPVTADAVTLGLAEHVTCTITNVAVPATVEVDKYWVVNGGEPMLDGTQPGYLDLSAQLTVNGDDHSWNSVIGGFLRGAPVSIDEDVTVGNDLCRETGASVVEINGSAADEALPFGTTVLGGTNHYTVTNEVTCTSELTLVKVVDHGNTGDETDASAFTLTATPSGIPDEPTLSGAGGASSAVSAGDYVLSEDGPSTYAADEAGWSCVAGEDNVGVSESTVTVPLATSVTCTIINHAIPSEWMVSKTSDPPSGSTVQPGEQIDYTVTLTKVGDGVPVEDFDVTDTLTGVEDSWVSGLEDEGASISNGVITWPVAELGTTPLTLTYTVTVGADAWDSEIDNVVTPGPVPCEETLGDDCGHTEHFTPHYTLDKAVQLLDEPGDGDNLAEPGEHLKYTLTVTNDTKHAVVDTVITDDASSVFDNATLVSKDAALEFDGSTFTWTITDLQPGDTAEVSYVVEINAGAWGVSLHNIATPVPDDGGECVPPGDVPGGTDDNSECETTTDTPQVTTMVVEKRDLESDEVLPDATFQLYDAGAIPEGGCDFGDPVAIPSEDKSLGTATTNDIGQGLFHDLQHGCYVLVEITAPPGYALPDHPVMGIQVDESNFVAGGEMTPIVVTDFAEGQLAIVAKQQFEFHNGAWEPSDGVVDFGDRVRYVVRVNATGPKNFHNVQVTDYVPGYNPEDTTSTVKATLVPDSAKCEEGLTCTVSVDPVTQLVTFDVGDLTPPAGVSEGGTAVMEVQFPDKPDGLVLDPGDTYTATLWNQGYLDWDEAIEQTAPTFARTAGGGVAGHLSSLAMVELPMQHHSLVSNEVIVTASFTAPPTKTHHEPGDTPGKEELPQTGAPAGLGPIAAISGLLLALGLRLGLSRRKEE